jgi:chemotaxis signal transduction protein
MMLYSTGGACSTEGVDLICCEIGNQTFALRASQTRAIRRIEELAPRAVLDGYVGDVGHEGQAVPVLSLARRLGLDASDALSHVIVADHGDAVQGWLVGRVTRRARADGDVAPLPESAGMRAGQLFEGLATVLEQPVLVVQMGASHWGRDVRPSRDVDVERRGRREGGAPLVLVFGTRAIPMPAGAVVAMSASQVCEVLQAAPIVPLPGRPAGVRGLVAWRGLAVPVVDLTGASAAGPTARIVIACERRGSSRPTYVAIPIDGDARLHRIAIDASPAAGSKRAGLLHGLFDIDGQTLALVNVGAVSDAMTRPIALGGIDDGLGADHETTQPRSFQ